MKAEHKIDYETYKEVMGELALPIEVKGLDSDTVKRLYESKLVYLENLRVNCFRDINSKGQSRFTIADYELVLLAIHVTRTHLRESILQVISERIEKKKAC